MIALRTRLQILRYVDVATARRIGSTTAYFGFGMVMGSRSRLDLTVNSSVPKWFMARAIAYPSRYPCRSQLLKLATKDQFWGAPATIDTTRSSALTNPDLPVPPGVGDPRPLRTSHFFAALNYHQFVA
jgi:hypothetical protein